MSGYFAFVRNLQTGGGSNIKDFAQISSAEAHAKRLDATSQARQVKGRSHEDNHFWSLCGEGLEGGGADYVTAFKEHKKRHAITSERKGAALAQHLLVGVSPGWLEEAGDPRDTANPRVQQLVAEAKAWAESWMGEGAVWAVRYDTDEKGAGVVDILASPIRTQHHKTGKSKPAISVRKANAELAEKHDLPNAFQAMQTDWAEWSQSRLDPQLQRGRPKSETDREHVPPDVYADQIAELQQEREELWREQDEHKKMVEAHENYRIGVSNLSKAVELVQNGTHDNPSKMFNRLAEISPFIKATFPEEQRTEGNFLRHRALDYSNGEPLPFPETLRDRLAASFDRVASWAAEVSKVRQEAQAITRDAEKAAEALLKDARAEAAHITEKATPERFLTLEREVEDLKNSLRAWTAFRNLFREKVQALLGLDGSARFAADLNASWKQHPDNPDRETTTPAPRSSGPSR